MKRYYIYHESVKMENVKGLNKGIVEVVKASNIRELKSGILTLVDELDKELAYLWENKNESKNRN